MGLSRLKEAQAGKTGGSGPLQNKVSQRPTPVSRTSCCQSWVNCIIVPLVNPRSYRVVNENATNAQADRYDRVKSGDSTLVVVAKNKALDKDTVVLAEPRQ